MSSTKKKDGTRFYSVPDGTGGTVDLPSVTTVLGIIAKPALVYWSANAVANYACDNIGTIKDLLDKGDREGAYRLLKGSPWAQRDKAAEKGTSVHAIVEKIILGDESALNISAAEFPFVESFRQFVQDHPTGTFEASEMTVFNLSLGYAGTLDALFRVGSRVGALDWKVRAGKKAEDVSAYETELLQVAAYCNAEFVLLPDGAVEPMPRVDGGSIILLCDDGFGASKEGGSPPNTTS